MTRDFPARVAAFTTAFLCACFCTLAAIRVLDDENELAILRAHTIDDADFHMFALAERLRVQADESDIQALKLSAMGDETAIRSMQGEEVTVPEMEEFSDELVKQLEVFDTRIGALEYEDERRRF